jgi:hypothetical protein
MIMSIFTFSGEDQGFLAVITLDYSLRVDSYSFTLKNNMENFYYLKIAFRIY